MKKIRKKIYNQRVTNVHLVIADEMKILIRYETYMTSVFSTSSVTGAKHIGCHYSKTSEYLSAGFLINNWNRQGLQYFGTFTVRLKLAINLYNINYQMFIEYLSEISSIFIINYQMIDKLTYFQTDNQYRHMLLLMRTDVECENKMAYELTKKTYRRLSPSRNNCLATSFNID